MTKKLLSIIIALIIIIIVIAINLPDNQTVQIKTERVIYDITVEIADSHSERAQGLMGREHLDEDEGMLFIYEEERHQRFWMKNMKIPLDIIFIGSDHKIKYIEKEVQPCSLDVDKCPTYGSSFVIQYVLEVQSGLAEKFNININDEVIFTY